MRRPGFSGSTARAGGAPWRLGSTCPWPGRPVRAGHSVLAVHPRRGHHPGAQLFLWVACALALRRMNLCVGEAGSSFVSLKGVTVAPGKKEERGSTWFPEARCPARPSLGLPRPSSRPGLFSLLHRPEPSCMSLVAKAGGQASQGFGLRDEEMTLKYVTFLPKRNHAVSPPAPPPTAPAPHTSAPTSSSPPGPTLRPAEQS